MVTPDPLHPTPPPDYSSPEPDHDHHDDVDYLQLTRDLERSVEESEAECESGFCFPQPPSPTFFTEAPTPEFIGNYLLSLETVLFFTNLQNFPSFPCATLVNFPFIHPSKLLSPCSATLHTLCIRTEQWLLQ